MPLVELANKDKQKNIFGVIGILEDKNKNIRWTGQALQYSSFFEENDKRLDINGVGEGGVWVCNKNGPLENGDYITSSSVCGYGMCQDDDLLHNYTCAKITCDCDFIKRQITKIFNHNNTFLVIVLIKFWC